MATSEQHGKDNSGDYVYRIGTDNAPVLDEHHHLVVEHDLDKIASEFGIWGAKQKPHSAKRASKWRFGVLVKLSALVYQPPARSGVLPAALPGRLAQAGWHTQPRRIASFAFVTDGIHGPPPDEVEEGGVRYLSAKVC